MIATYNQTHNNALNTSLILSALPICCDFLTPRELFNFVFCSKQLMKSISISTIVKIALCNGNSWTKQGIEHLYDAMKYRSIHCPSPQRLLRLINVRLCEFCKRKRINFVPEIFGLASCFECTKKMTTWQVCKHPRYRERNVELNDIVSNPRVAVKIMKGKKWYAIAGCDWHSGSQHDRVQAFYVWNKKTFDTLGENIGPIVTRGALHKMVRFQRLESVDNLIVSLEKSKSSSGSDYSYFLTGVQAFRGVSFQKLRDRRNKMIQARRQARARRLSRIEEHVASMKGLLPSSKRHLLRYHVNEHYINSSPLLGERSGNLESLCIHFECYDTWWALQDFIRWPSKLNSTTKRRKVILVLQRMYTGEISVDRSRQIMKSLL